MFTGDSKEYFRQVGGLQHVQKLMFTEIPTPVLQAAMFCLACAIENQGLHQVLACLLFRHCPYFSIRWTYNRELWTENKLGSRFPLLFFKPNILFSSAPTPHTHFFVFFYPRPCIIKNMTCSSLWYLCNTIELGHSESRRDQEEEGELDSHEEA